LSRFAYETQLEDEPHEFDVGRQFPHLPAVQVPASKLPHPLGVK